MSRSGYSDGGENIAMWRGQVASAIRGKRGQAFLRELLAALDAMPEKRLIQNDLQRPDGNVCALGTVGLSRGLAMGSLDPYDYDTLAGEFGIAHQLIQEIEYINDEAWEKIPGSVGHYQITPETRWSVVRAWVGENIRSSDLPPEGPQP